ncbi:MAG: mRNA-capping enzyme subunit beta [Watsoniomyces obsoletus]|nr:MAG: mRNA-capping enzyme subunit beta [Watsoniomyces obsoletus]
MADNAPNTEAAGDDLIAFSESGRDVAAPPEAPTALAEPVGHEQAVEPTSTVAAEAVHQPYSKVPPEEIPQEPSNTSQAPSVGEHEDDAFRFLKDISRSNSFPVVPPRDRPRTALASSLEPPIQEELEPEEEINEAVDATQPRPADSFTEIAPFDGSGSLADFSIHTETDPASSFDFARFSDAQVEDAKPTDAEARYDEGLPLIQGDQQPEEEEDAEKQDVGRLQSEVVTHSQQELSNQADTDLFPGVSTPYEFAPLQRKSTAQVIESLGTDSKEVQSDFTGIHGPPAADDVTATMGTQQHSRTDGALDDQALADMWKAALGDDDLLEEPVDSSDTAQLFPSDGQWGGEEEFSWNAIPASENTTQQPPAVGAASIHSPYAPGNAPAPPNGTFTAGRRSEGDISRPYAVQPQPSSDQSSPPQPSVANAYGQPGLNGGIAPTPQGWATQQQLPPTQRPGFSKAQSFVDKSKSDYRSPYDLPADITKPRKRGSAQHAPMYSNQQISGAGPPPRSASAFTAPPNQAAMPTTGIASPVLPPPPAPGSRPQYATMGNAHGGRTATMPAVPAAKSSTSATNFFEDLPVTAGPRRSADAGRGSIAGAATLPRAPPRALPPMPVAVGQPSFQGGISDGTRPPPESPPLLAAAQLQPPQRMDPFAPSSRPSTAPRSTSATSSRYSPAPPAQAAARTREKYAPMPAGTGPPPMPHQPRTSSPLAHRSISHSQGAPQHAEPAYTHELHHQPEQFSRPPETHTARQGPVQGYGEPPQDQPHHDLPHENVYSTSAPGAPAHHWHGNNDRYAPGNVHHRRPMSDSPPSASSHSSVKRRPQPYPARTAHDAPSSQLTSSPPRRSQTQSPGAVLPGQPQFTAQHVPYPRPASVDAPTSPKSIMAHPAIAGLSSSGPSRGMSQHLNYIAPTDGREFDPLSRWRGCPIFSWGFGGTIVTSFPKEVQRYSSGQQFPSLKCSPGEVRTRSAKDILPLDEHITRFPGPLRGKGKKKDVVAWVALRIEQLKGNAQMSSPEECKKRDERILLLQVLQILVQHDGHLTGSDVVQKAVHDALAFHLPSSGDPDASASYTNAIAAQPVPSTADSQSITSIRRALLDGNRESAVWQAVDKRMWAHAMLISSAASPDLWKQVVREFVRNEVRKAGPETESLAALYQIFAGNSEESIDELVPVSARAGLQLISKNVDTRSSKSGLEGLDKWLETMMLVLSNRSADDQRALAALAKLLLDYGRVEAAHVCLLFAGPFAPFGGADDPQSVITLLGEHVRHHTYGDMTDAILLTEIYEFGLSLASPGSAFAAPHLQAYKYYHALRLAQHGYRNEAQHYCEAIGQTLRSAPKSSGQYYSALVSPLEDLTKRLQRALKDESSSWISKPSIEKVSDSLFAKFNSFVAGSDHDRTAAGADGDKSGNDVGPFARIAGNTPVISRPASQNDVYRPSLPYSGPATMNRSATGLVGSHSRYTPIPGYAPHGFSNQGQPGYGGVDSFASSRENLQPNRLSEASAGGSGYPNSQGYMPHQPSNLVESQATSSSPDLVNPYAPASQGATYPPPGYGDSTPSLQGYPYQPASSGQMGMHQPDNHTAPGQEDNTPTVNGGYTPYTSSYQPPSYEPLSSADAGYEPPTNTSEETAGQNGSASFDEPSRKRSPYMDIDDDDGGGRAADLSRQEKQRKDKEAEENFRKAAEADAKRGQLQSGEKKGWLTGWFSGKKEQAPGSGPIRAKLGEESSFYYDTDLKKWVNKKGGTQPTPTSSTPPPPKGPPSRALSGSAPPPSTSSRGPPPSGPPLPSNPSAPPPSNLSLGRNHTLPLPTSSHGAPSSSSSSAPGTATFSARTPSPAAAAGGSVPDERSGQSLPSFPVQSTQGQGQAPGPNSNATNNPPSLPPSRSATSVSNASSIDDLLGPATARKGGTMKKAKKGRYVDVMAGGAPTPPPPPSN